MAEGVWTLYNFVLTVSLEIVLTCVVMVTVFYAFPKTDQSKADLDRERTEWSAKLQRTGIESPTNKGGKKRKEMMAAGTELSGCKRDACRLLLLLVLRAEQPLHGRATALLHKFQEWWARIRCCSMG